MVTMRMQADLKLQVGTRFFYDCPSMSMDDYKADVFFRKYKGKEGTILGFTTAPVLPLNKSGLKLGLYYNGGVTLQFDGDHEIHTLTKPNHFRIIGPAQVVSGEVNNFASNLPEDPAFYPFDVVMKLDDLLATPRLVVSIDYNRDDMLVCDLADTEDMELARNQKERAEREQAKAKSLWYPAMTFRSDESVDASDLRLIERGNVYWLYHDHTKMSLDSIEEELGFWSLDGISKVVHVNERWWFPLKRAREIVASGAGDIIIESIHATHGDDTCEVLRLHDLFDQYRGRIRALADGVVVSAAKPMRDPFKDLVGMMTRW